MIKPYTHLERLKKRKLLNLFNINSICIITNWNFCIIFCQQHVHWCWKPVMWVLGSYGEILWLWPYGQILWPWPCNRQASALALNVWPWLKIQGQNLGGLAGSRPLQEAQLPLREQGVSFVLSTHHDATHGNLAFWG